MRVGATWRAPILRPLTRINQQAEVAPLPLGDEAAGAHGVKAHEGAIHAQQLARLRGSNGQCNVTCLCGPIIG